MIRERDAGWMPRIVAFGGGTGMSVLLKGLKRFTDRTTAVVTVGDDGGSSGRLRTELDVPPPGDIRNCIIALADTEPLMEELLQYRFDESELAGHSFGNLLLVALTKITGDFKRAVQEANRILRVRGRVLPATLKKVSIVAHHADGTKTTGEVRVGKTRKPVVAVELQPKPVPATDEVFEAIEQADLFVFGPGSLYTSVIPTLLVDGIVDAIKRNPAKKVYVCNIMTQPNETTGYTVCDHVLALLNHTSSDFLDYVIVNTEVPNRAVKEQYMRRGQYPVKNDAAELDGVKVVEANLLGGGEQARHDPEKLASCIMEILLESLGCKVLPDEQR